VLNFKYKAVKADGSVVTGNLLGDSREQIVARIQANGQILLWVDQLSSQKNTWSLKISKKKKVTQQQIADSTRELSTLLRAGLPLNHALDVLISLSGDSSLGDLLGNIQQGVKEGATLADAMEAEGNIFSRFYTNLIRAGESTGSLELVLERLAAQMESAKALRDELTSALIYPAVLVFVAVGSILVLLGYVIPQFTEMFEDVGQALPLSTRITISIGEVLQRYGWVLITALALLVWTIRRQLKEDDTAIKWHKCLLHLPLAGPIILKMEVAHFARTLSILLHNGIPLLKALMIVKDTMSNLVLAKGIESVAGSLRKGQSLAEPLAELASFPAFAIHMIGVGEESGNLQEILTQVADTYDRDTQTTMKRALALLEPMLILVLGVVIAAAIMSILVAILSVNDLVI
jgi:general secretion pathway protein F